MTSQPDFVVDPSGRVQDVRHQKHSQESGSPSQKPKTRYTKHRAGGQVFAQSTQKPRRTPYVIFIPIGLILTIIVSLFRLCSAPTPNDSYSELDISLLRSGTSRYLEGEYDMALVDINMVIRSNPDFGEAYNARGLVYHAKGDYDRAIEDFDKVIELLPDWAAGYNNRGATYSAESEYDQAIADLDRAIQLDADFAKAYYNRGLVYLVKGNYDAAIGDFDKAIQFTDEASYTTLNARPPSGGAPLLVVVSKRLP